MLQDVRSLCACRRLQLSMAPAALLECLEFQGPRVSQDSQDSPVSHHRLLQSAKGCICKFCGRGQLGFQQDGTACRASRHQTFSLQDTSPRSANPFLERAMPLGRFPCMLSISAM